MRKLKLGKLSISAVEYASQGNAILGIRDSGKTYTATGIAEQLYDAKIPFVAFDPIGVWRFLRVPGKGKGYPVVVAGGGKHGDLPLTVATAPEIVRSAMHNGVSLVIDLFDMNLSKADWRRIVKDCVRVLLHENKDHGLRHIFLEEAAEFAPQKVLDGDVYAEIEKLARMGGNSRLGYTLINQRAQELNKAVLELCENLFLHRQRGKNAIESLSKWLDVAGAGERDAIVKSLPELPQGNCWAWIGGDTPRPPQRVTIQPKNSLHPDRRAMHGRAKTKKAVNVGSFIKAMKTTLTTIETEVKVTKDLKADLEKLKREKVALERQLEAKAAKPAKPDKDAIAAAEKRGIDKTVKAKVTPLLSALEVAMKFIVEINAKDFFKAGGDAVDPKAVEKAIADATAHITKLIGASLQSREKQLDQVRKEAERVVRQMKALIEKSKEDVKVSVEVTHNKPFTVASKSNVAPLPTKAPPAIAGDSTYSAPQMKILRALTMWRSLGDDQPTRAKVAAVAGYSYSSGGFANLLGQLNTATAITYPAPGLVALNVNGIADMTREEGAAMMLSVLSNPQKKIVGALTDGEVRDRAQLGEATGYSPTSGGFANLLGSLSTLGIITYPSKGNVQLEPWAIELLRDMSLAA